MLRHSRKSLVAHSSCFTPVAGDLKLVSHLGDLAESFTVHLDHTASTPGDSSQPTAPNQSGSQTVGASKQRRKQHCVVEGCPELIAPSMWKSHMTLHAQGVFPREVTSTWLDEQDRYICHICLQLVSNRRQSSHSKKCNAGGVASSVPDFAGPLPPNPAEALLNQHEPGLPTFEDVCLLNQPTLRFVPLKSRPAFARALSSALRCVILENTEEAWLKLFMLPKCVPIPQTGIAPNNDTTWQLLKSKHPSCPTPVPPVVHTTPVSLEPDFNIIAILQSYPKDTAAGPSGLRVQHLLDVISIPLHTPICSSLRQVSHDQADAEVLAAETHKLHSNGPKCQGLGWSCIPLAVETYGNWGKEAQDTISRLASHLAIHQSSPKSSVMSEIYGRLNMTLVWSIATAILARELPP
eukprot:Em0009g626a